MPRFSRILTVLTFFIVIFVAYGPAMRNSFVWDDTALILRDPLIRHWRQAPEAFQENLFLDATASEFYRPIQRLTYIADYTLWGISRETGEKSATQLEKAAESDGRTKLVLSSTKAGGPEGGETAPAPMAKTGAPDTGDGRDVHLVEQAAQPGWHFTSVLMHALAALALWALLRQWFGAGGEWWAFALALLWAVHPLHTSAVTYVSGRADSLAALFAFSALYFVAQAHAAGRLNPTDRAAARQVIAAMVCGFFALLSKESGVAAFTLWAVWIAFKTRGDRRSWIALTVAVGIALVAWASLRLSAGKTPVPPKGTAVTFVERGTYFARALAEYATLFVAPHDLHMERDIRTKATDAPATVTFRHVQTAGGIAILLGLLLWARWAWRRAPDAVLALVAAGVTWLPMSNLVTLNATVAEHWIYVPTAFMLAATGFSLRALAINGRALAVGTAVCGLALICVTFGQQEYWRNQRTFIEWTARRAGLGPRMLVQYGQLAYADAHANPAAPNPEKIAEAERYYREALRLDPTLDVAHTNLAAMALEAKDFATAKRELDTAEKLPLYALFKPMCLVIRARIAQAETGQPQINTLAEAANLAPRNWGICSQLPLALRAMGKPDRALNEILRFNAGQPYRAEAFRMLAECAEQLGNSEAAARAYGDAANRDSRDEVSRAKLRAFREKR